MFIFRPFVLFIVLFMSQVSFSQTTGEESYQNAETPVSAPPLVEWYKVVFNTPNRVLESIPALVQKIHELSQQLHGVQMQIEIALSPDSSAPAGGDCRYYYFIRYSRLLDFETPPYTAEYSSGPGLPGACVDFSKLVYIGRRSDQP